jgi:lysozyme family protein
MSDFNLAQPFILKNEGGYVNDPNDAGQETYRGISRKNFPYWSGWVIVDNSKPLSANELIKSTFLDTCIDSFYKVEFWDRIHGDSIQLQPVASYLYDFYVNASHNAIKCVQRIVGVSDDGLFGSGTLNALNAYRGDLLGDLHNARIDYYVSLNNPRYVVGWKNRANQMYFDLNDNGGVIA